MTSAWPLAGISSARSGVNLTSHPVGSDAENVTLRAGALPLFLTTSFSGELLPAVALPESRLSGVVTDSSGLPVTSTRSASSGEAQGRITRTAMGEVTAGTVGGRRPP